MVLFFTLVSASVIYYYYDDINKFIKGYRQTPQTYNLYKKQLNKYTYFGIDVSEYQKDIDWETVFENQNIDFVIVRATAGRNKKDKTFNNNWKALADNDVIRGAYHYYRPNENSEKQAKFFIKNVKFSNGDLPPILDIEKYSKIQSINSLKTGVLNWLKIVEEHYGVKPIIYTYNKFYTSTLKNDSRFDKYPVWIAWYNTEKDPDNILKGWVFWQFTDKGIIKGIEGEVDINVFNPYYSSINLFRQVYKSE